MHFHNNTNCLIAPHHISGFILGKERRNNTGVDALLFSRGIEYDVGSIIPHIMIQHDYDHIYDYKNVEIVKAIPWPEENKYVYMVII